MHQTAHGKGDKSLLGKKAVMAKKISEEPYQENGRTASICSGKNSPKIYIHKGAGSIKTLPEAQRTQGIAIDQLNRMPQIRLPDGAICISCKIVHQMASLALVANLATI